MNQDQINYIELFLKDNVQLGSIEYFQNEDDDYIFMSEDCMLTFKDDYIIMDLDIELYPDISAYMTLGINDLANELGKEIRIGEVYSFDENFDIHFGEEAIKYSQKHIDDQVENIVEMDHILMFSEGIEC